MPTKLLLAHPDFQTFRRPCYSRGPIQTMETDYLGQLVTLTVSIFTAARRSDFCCCFAALPVYKVMQIWRFFPVNATFIADFQVLPLNQKRIKLDQTFFTGT